MGEATYYLKAQFKNQQAAAKALPKVKAFIEEVGKAYTYWQDSRAFGLRKSSVERTSAEFWAAMETKYPQAYDFLKFQGLAGGDHNNALAGNISFGDANYLDSLQTDDDCLLYHELTWHFADWQPFCEYLKLKFGAEKVGYVSDEYVQPDYYGMVELV